MLGKLKSICRYGNPNFLSSAAQTSKMQKGESSLNRQNVKSGTAFRGCAKKATFYFSPFGDLTYRRAACAAVMDYFGKNRD